jgi:AraC family ethanolamine operon transcriptional activator
VTLAAASRELDASIRSIQLAVEEYFGINFVRFGRLVRLHQVHSALVLGLANNVSEAATQHGFWHLGRFSRYYREVFGEPPSQTVRGARLQPAVSSAVRRRLMRRSLDALKTAT